MTKSVIQVTTSDGTIHSCLVTPKEIKLLMEMEPFWLEGMNGTFISSLAVIYFWHS